MGKHVKGQKNYANISRIISPSTSVICLEIKSLNQRFVLHLHGMGFYLRAKINFSKPKKREAKKTLKDIKDCS